MADRDGFIWYDGELVEWRNATTHVLTHTLHYGMGVFEGVRAYQTAKGAAIFRLQDHTDRLFRSAKILNIALPFSKEQINQGACGCSQSQQAGLLLLPPDGLLWLR
ncbi:aminotransferase class IV [Paludibacterium denitrificans]|uniref:aminotransferase class IV n=1 Tax=Paludibacterium denitrificans TaxID=2675226 RepID=UPI0035E459B8